MPSYRISQAAALLGVSTDTVRRWGDDGRFTISTDRTNHKVIDGEVLAAFAASLADTADVPTVVGESARNRFTGIVTKVIRDVVMAQVELQAGPHRLVSLMSREAADELGLVPGVLAVGAIKATNVIVELPETQGKNL
ncbi:MAG: TOBE domain-containing protein [Acidimicrobiales bacterium]